MPRGCAAVIVLALLVLGLLISCTGKDTAPKPPPGSVVVVPPFEMVDSLAVVLMPMAGDTSQACAFARLVSGRWALTSVSDSLPVCRDSFREWLDVRDVQRL